MRSIATVAVALALIVTTIGSTSAFAASSTWHVQAGSLAFGPTGPSGGGNRFYPAAMSIHVGDSVAFAPMGAHTVTLNRPPGPVFALFGPSGNTTISSLTQVLNSGFIGTSPTPAPFTVTFDVAGQFTFICSIHLGMTETIDVLPTSQQLPRTDAEYTAIAQEQITEDLEALREIVREASVTAEVEDSGPIVFAGFGNDRVTSLRFYPAAVTVHVGQTVTFLKTQDPTEPHTVTFGPPPPDQFLELLPAGGPTYDGTGLANSGFLSTPAQYSYYQLAGVLPPPTTTYRLTFTKAGTYEYICGLHDQIGMTGTVIVLP